MIEIGNQNNLPKIDQEEKNWSLANINWETFKQVCEEEMIKIDEHNVEEAYIIFVETLNNIMIRLGKVKSKRRQNPVPWWNKECSQSIKERNHLRYLAEKRKTGEYVEDYLEKKAEAQKIKRQAKRDYWITYCKEMTRFTSMIDIWNMKRKIENSKTNKKKTNIESIIYEKKEIINPQEVVNVMANHFENISKSTIINKQAENIVKEYSQENVNDDQEQRRNQSLNQKFTMQDFNQVLKIKKIQH